MNVDVDSQPATFDRFSPDAFDAAFILDHFALKDFLTSRDGLEVRLTTENLERADD